MTGSARVGAPGADGQAQAALQLRVFTSPTHRIGTSKSTFSPTTSTLIFGAREAVLVDAQYITADIDALADMVRDVGRTLTTIFVTHAHADHYFGIDRLAHRFPTARIVATPAVAGDVAARGDEQIATFSAWFGDAITVPTSVPEPLVDGTLTVDGHLLHAVDVEQADISPSSLLHVPDLDAVIAGDAVYNGIHQMMALTGPADWEKWIASVDAIAALTPRTVIAGHKKPAARDDDGARILAMTRDYIRDFADAARRASSPDELVAEMRTRYPEHGNLTTLLVSARSALATGGTA
jgi:glyoxylase-like metal-dependent hydrolase (beta-lactamase superfamily II)